MDQPTKGTGQATLDDVEVQAVRALVAGDGREVAAAKALGISGYTILKVLSGIPLSVAMVSHIRARLAGAP